MPFARKFNPGLCRKQINIGSIPARYYSSRANFPGRGLPEFRTSSKRPLGDPFCKVVRRYLNKIFSITINVPRIFQFPRPASFSLISAIFRLPAPCPLRFSRREIFPGLRASDTRGGEIARRRSSEPRERLRIPARRA